MNPLLNSLQPYPFEKLLKLKEGVTPPSGLPHIALSIGEPRHEPPAFVLEEVQQHLPRVVNYPTTKGLDELREAMAAWACRRFLGNRPLIDADTQILPVNGTREALFSFAQAVIDSRQPAKVLMPNPFYQIYEGAALLAGAEPVFINCPAENRFHPDFDNVSDATWDACQLLYICSPGNPTGTVLSSTTLQQLIILADKHDFVIASDECYSELYFDEQSPPPGLLQACMEMGRDDFARCAVFHSLSKRSNLPGLRSGFVAGDAAILKKFYQYRTYHGCAMPTFSQLASIAAWNDESHVAANRELYRQKFNQVLDLLNGCLEVERPEAGFYLWARTPATDTGFARQLFAEENITVLPGSYLARDTQAGNPGAGRVRMALVASVEECAEAAVRLRRFCEGLKGLR